MMRVTTAVRPKLVLPDAAGAIDLYVRVLGANEVARYTAGDVVVFAEISVLGSTITLKDADDADPVPEPGPILDVLCEDPDALATALLDAGASEVFAMSDQPYGGRWGRVRDPFGVQWLLHSPATMSPAEIQAEIQAEIRAEIRAEVTDGPASED
jgi:PhnB protein